MMLITGTTDSGIHIFLWTQILKIISLWKEESMGGIFNAQMENEG